MKKTKMMMVCASVIMALAACATTPNSTTNIQAADQHAPEQGTGLTEQKLVHAHQFMVASANPLASQAGYEILKKGGSAVDAMIAIQAALGLVEPQSSGLGGGAFVVYWDNEQKKLTTFDARETAPASATPSLFTDKTTGKAMPFKQAVVGGRSVGTPAIPKLMETLHQRYGRLAWANLFDSAIKLADDGFAVSPRMAQSIQQNLDTLTHYPETAAYFVPNGQPLRAGSLLKNPDYAMSLKTLAKEGSKPFYQGQYAKNIIQAVRNAKDNPGLLDSSDFQNYQVIERQAVCVPYRVYEVCGMGAPSSGGLAVGQIVGMVNQFDSKEMAQPNLRTWRILGDASRLAFADREKYVADPKFVSVPNEFLLSHNYLKQRAELLKNTENALPEVSAGVVPKFQFAASPAIELPSTSHVVVVDSKGNVLSMTTSIENAFGSGVMANGYLLNNQLTDFSLEPEVNGVAVANRVEGGKRPRSSMAPMIIMKNHQPYWAMGSPGGSRIIGFVAKTLVAHIDWNMDIQQAISLPNMLNRFGVYELEQNTSAAQYQDGLQKLGYKTEIRDLNSGVQGIVLSSDGLWGAADPRREGKVLGD